MAYLMAGFVNKNFDAKKWGEANKDLAEKSYERWKKDNIEPGTTSSGKETTKPVKK